MLKLEEQTSDQVKQNPWRLKQSIAVLNFDSWIYIRQAHSLLFLSRDNLSMNSLNSCMIQASYFKHSATHNALTLAKVE